MKNPKVIDPPNFDLDGAWRECADWVGEHNDRPMMAAAGADPGCCSCPVCKESYWRWGNVIECECGFQFPVDWCTSFRDGAADGRGVAAGAECSGGMKLRLENPYYRCGFEARPDNAFDVRHSFDWAAIAAGWQPTPDVNFSVVCERCGNKKNGVRAGMSGLCAKCELLTECRHRCSRIHTTCEAGVRFDSFPKGPATCPPCFYVRGRKPLACDKFEPKTIDEIREHDAILKAHIENVFAEPAKERVKGD